MCIRDRRYSGGGPMEDQGGARVSAALDHRGEDGAAPSGRDRSRLEETLRSPAQTRKTIEGERDLLAAVLEAADVLFVILDEQGRILRVNHAFEVATGYRGGDLRGRDFLDTLPIPEARETFTDGIRSLRAGVATFAFENHWRKSGGAQFALGHALLSHIAGGDDDGLESTLGAAHGLQRPVGQEALAAALSPVVLEREHRDARSQAPDAIRERLPRLGDRQGVEEVPAPQVSTTVACGHFEGVVHAQDAALFVEDDEEHVGSLEHC